MQLLTTAGMGLELGDARGQLGLLRALATGIRAMADDVSDNVAGRDPQAARMDALALRARRGDRPSLERLLRELAPHVLRLSHYLVGTADAHDAAQDSLTLVATRLDRFDRERGGFRPWALALTRNHCLDRLRRRGVERRAFAAEASGSLAGATASAEHDPERKSIVSGELSRVQSALSHLPEGMASALVLFHVQGIEYEEIAQTLEVPVGTVMSWLHRGRKRLRAALEEEG